jgi:hypothetical protein
MQIDFEFDFMVLTLDHLDELLRRLTEAHLSCEDPEGFLDQMEWVYGMGFATIQAWSTARVRTRPKASSLACGPKHAKLYVAKVINAAANYWKHNAEWPSDSSQYTAQQQATADILRDVGVWKHDYKLMNLLSDLVEPNRFCFRSLLPLLDEWRSALDPGGFLFPFEGGRDPQVAAELELS